MFDFISKAVKSIEHVPGVSDLAKSAQGMLPPDIQQGFNSGLAAFQAAQNSPVGAIAAQAARAALPAIQKQGFDMAAAMVNGKATGPVAPVNLSPQARIAYNITHGMAGNEPQHNAAIMTTLSAHPEGAAGVALAREHQKGTDWLWLRRLGWRK